MTVEQPGSRHYVAQASQRVVASAEVLDPTALPPLSAAVDPVRVVRSSRADGLRVRSECSGYEAALSGDNSVEFVKQDD